MGNRRLKILIICGQYPPTIGGGGTHTSYLCNELSNLKSPGAKVALITSHIPGTQKMETKKNGLEIYRVDFKHSESLIYESAISKSLAICEKFDAGWSIFDRLEARPYGAGSFGGRRLCLTLPH